MTPLAIALLVVCRTLFIESHTDGRERRNCPFHAVRNVYVARQLSVCEDTQVLTSDAVGNIDIWDQIMAVNSRGVFLCYKYAAEVMIKQGKGGRIVGASSVAGKQGMAVWATVSLPSLSQYLQV